MTPLPAFIDSPHCTSSPQHEIGLIDKERRDIENQAQKRIKAIWTLDRENTSFLFAQLEREISDTIRKASNLAIRYAAY
jgi:hypothetical protein